MFKRSYTRRLSGAVKVTIQPDKSSIPDYGALSLRHVFGGDKTSGQRFGAN